jgi:hypothetical protein
VTLIINGVFDCPPATRAMIERQGAAWISGNFALAARDWHPQGYLIAPGHHVLLNDIPAAIAGLHRDYRDLVITITAAFQSPAGWLCLEWLWEITRRSDHARSTTHDAIVVEPKDGLILSWREYFDTFGSVETHHAP